MTEKAVLKAGEERFFPIHSLVAFWVNKADFADNFVREHGDPGPFLVIKNQGFPPGHGSYSESPQRITIAVNGGLVHLPGSLFVPY